MKPIFSFLLRLLRTLDLGLRLVLNLIVLVFILVIIGALFGPSAPSVPDGAALILNPKGILVEEFTGRPLERAANQFFGDEIPEVRVIDLLKVIQAATTDERIKLIVLDTDGLLGGGLAKLQEISAALLQFKAQGKKVIALGSGFSQNQYYLASVADEIHMHPMGLVFISGYSAYTNYFKEGLDKLGVEWNVFSAGDYKSFGEPYTRSDMSPEAKEANFALIEVLWRAYQEDTVAARGLDQDAISAYVNSLVDPQSSHHGDLSRLALETGLVDYLSTRDEMRRRIAELVEVDMESEEFPEIQMDAYLAHLNTSRQISIPGRDEIAVVVASGTILDGWHPPGTVGGSSTSSKIQHAVDAENVKAIILRVDSPGGSTFASDLILRELEIAQEHGIPVIVSMSSVAASGGYWIAMSADEIWASPTTVTGSIGVVAMFPTFEGTLAKIGIHTDGVSTTPLAGSLRPDRSLPDEVKRTLQLSVDNYYDRFISKVSLARDIDEREVREIARGRVWSGEDAFRLGLVDRMGGITEALESAAEIAGIGDDYRVRIIEQEMSLSDQLLINIFNSFESIPVVSRLAAGARDPRERLLGSFIDRISDLLKLNDPSGIYFHCLCDRY